MMRKRRKNTVLIHEYGFMQGPWKDIEATESGCRECVSSKCGHLICSVYTQSGERKYNKHVWRANKRLIAKSPEMFGVLLELLEIDAESKETLQDGATPDDVVKIGKDILRVIEKSKKIVGFIRGAK